jgi:hypothetical protein
VKAHPRPRGRKKASPKRGSSSIKGTDTRGPIHVSSPPSKQRLSWRLPCCLQLAPVEVLGLALQVFLHNLIGLFLPARRD